MTTKNLFGTTIEGDWDTIFKGVKACHLKAYELDETHNSTNLKVGTRTGRTQFEEGKVTSVNYK